MDHQWLRNTHCGMALRSGKNFRQATWDLLPVCSRSPSCLGKRFASVVNPVVNTCSLPKRNGLAHGLKRLWSQQSQGEEPG